MDDILIANARPPNPGYIRKLKKKIEELTNARDAAYAERNQLVLVMGFQVKRHDSPLSVNNTGTARDLVADRCRRQVLHVDLDAHSALAGFEDRQHHLPGCVFEEPD